MALNTRVFFRNTSGAPVLGLAGATVEIKNLTTNATVGAFPLAEDALGIYFYDFATGYDPKDSYQAYFDSGTGLLGAEIYSGYQELLSDWNKLLGSIPRGGGGSGFWSKEVYEKFLKDLKETLDGSLSDIEVQMPDGWDDVMKESVSEVKATIAQMEKALEEHGENYEEEAIGLKKAILKSVEGIVEALTVEEKEEVDVVGDLTVAMKSHSLEMFDHFFEGMKEIVKHSLTDKEKDELKKEFKKDFDKMFETSNNKKS